jgi:hypothetical protein
MLVVETVFGFGVSTRREGDQGDCAGSAAVAQGGAQGDPGAGRRVRLSRKVQPLPRLGPFQERLDALLTENEARPGAIGCG